MDGLSSEVRDSVFVGKQESHFAFFFLSGNERVALGNVMAKRQRERKEGLNETAVSRAKVKIIRLP